MAVTIGFHGNMSFRKNAGHTEWKNLAEAWQAGVIRGLLQWTKAEATVFGAQQPLLGPPVLVYPTISIPAHFPRCPDCQLSFQPHNFLFSLPCSPR